MKKVLMVLIAVLMVAPVALYSVAPAMAEEDGGAFDEGVGMDEDSGDEAEEASYKKTTVIDFEEVLLEGELKKPTGSVILDRQQLSFSNLIKFRENFEPEMIKSVDKLK